MIISAMSARLLLLTWSCVYAGRHRDKGKLTLDQIKAERTTQSSHVQKHFTLEEAKSKLRFTYNADDPLTTEQVRAIKDRTARARAAPPNAPREVRSLVGAKEWQPTKETNGMFIERLMAQRRKINSDCVVRERSKNDVIEAQTGSRPLTRSRQSFHERRQEALSGDANETMRLRTQKGEWMPDARGRTKKEYYLKHCAGASSGVDDGPSAKRVRLLDLNRSPSPE